MRCKSIFVLLQLVEVMLDDQIWFLYCEVIGAEIDLTVITYNRTQRVQGSSRVYSQTRVDLAQSTRLLRLVRGIRRATVLLEVCRNRFNELERWRFFVDIFMRIKIIVKVNIFACVDSMARTLVVELFSKDDPGFCGSRRAG